MRITAKRTWLAALSAASLLALSACGGGDGGEESAQVADESLAAILADADGMSIVERSLKDAGLSEVFDGPAPYTMLAPRDSAFEQLGEAGKELTSAEQRPVMVALLRDHILPGYVTMKDIAAAIAKDAGGKVEMTTMGGSVLVFTKEGDMIGVSGSDGSKAHLLEGEVMAKNGVLIPLDGVLKKIEPEA